MKEKNSPDILLIMPPPWETKMPPLGLGYVSEFLRANGYKPEVFDINVELYNTASKSLKELWKISNISYLTPQQIGTKFIQGFETEIENFAAKISKYNTDLIGFSVNYLSVGVAEEISRKIKEKSPHKKIIFGGPGVYWDYNRENLSGNIVDMFIIGEGEIPLYEIVSHYKKSGELKSTPGTILKQNKEYSDLSSREPVKKLNKIPFPTFEGFNISSYWDSFPTNYDPIPILLSRGCIGNCSFCIDYKMCAPFRVRPPEEVVEEIKYHIDRYGTNSFAINDLLCNGSLYHLEKFCDLVIEEGLNLQMSSYAAVREGMSYGLLKKMKQAGFVSLCYGMESASDNVLQMMNKYYNSKTAEENMRNSYKAGIKTCINIIIGHPGETSKDFKDTLEFLKNNEEYLDEITNVSTCFINPSADIGENPEKYGIVFRDTNPWYIKILQKIKRFFKILFPFSNFIEIVKNHQLSNRLKKDINITNFHDITGNTPYVRMKRLKKCLSLLYKLDLPVTIINRPIGEDKKLEKIIEKAKNKTLIEKEELCTRFRNKEMRINWDNFKVTQGPGLECAFNIDGEWFNSFEGKYDILDEGKDFFKFRIINDIPCKIEQNWFIEVENPNLLKWEVDFSTNSSVDINVLQLGITLCKTFKAWGTPFERGYFSSNEMGNLISDEFTRASSLVGTVGEKDKSKLCLIFKPDYYKGIDKSNPLIQVSDPSVGTRQLAFQFWPDNESFSHFAFSGSLLMNSSFDWYISKLEEVKEKFIKGKSIRKGDLKFVGGNGGVKIYWKQKELTKGVGMNTSLLTREMKWYDCSDGEWEFKKESPYCLSINVDWDSFPIIQEWKIAIRKKRKFYWNIKMIVQRPIFVTQFKAGIMMNEKYRKWSGIGEEGKFPPHKKQWIDITPENNNTNFITVNGYEEDKNKVPGIKMILCNRSLKYAPQLQVSDNNLNAKFLNAIKSYPDFKKLKKGKYLCFEGEFELTDL